MSKQRGKQRRKSSTGRLRDGNGGTVRTTRSRSQRLREGATLKSEWWPFVCLRKVMNRAQKCSLD